MATFHKTKLAYLMDTFEITGIELGDFLHVDYSLISKWRNNKRILNDRNNYLNKIVDYFIALDDYRDHQRLKLLLNYDSSENLDKVLKHWLLDPEIQDQNNSLGLFSSNPEELKYDASISIYEGNKGRRNAVSNFLNAVLQVPGTPDLFLFSQEDMTWLTEDLSFLLKWRGLLTEILKNGNKITIIHTVDRNYSSLMSILEHWLPLHLTGRITPLYYPRYEDITYKASLFILKDHFAITGLFVEGFSKKTYTNLITDPIIIMQSQSIFQQFLSQSRHLYTPYHFNDFVKLSREIIEASKREENSYLRMNTPLIHLIPIEGFKLLLKENNFDKDTIEKLIFYHQNLEESFHQTIPHYYQRQIYSLEVFERIIEEDTLYYNELNMVKGKNIKIPLKYFCKQLQNIIELLDRYPNYQIALANRPINKLDNENVLIKENIITFAYSSSQPIDSSFYVSSTEPTVINAFFKYYENIWNSLPRANKDKEWIKTKLQNLIQKVKNRESYL